MKDEPEKYEKRIALDEELEKTFKRRVLIPVEITHQEDPTQADPENQPPVLPDPENQPPVLPSEPEIPEARQPQQLVANVMHSGEDVMAGTSHAKLDTDVTQEIHDPSEIWTKLSAGGIVGLDTREDPGDDDFINEDELLGLNQEEDEEDMDDLD